MSLEKAISQEDLTLDTVDAQFCSDYIKDNIKRLIRERDKTSQIAERLEKELKIWVTSDTQAREYANELRDDNKQLQSRHAALKRAIEDAVHILNKLTYIPCEASVYKLDDGEFGAICFVRDKLSELFAEFEKPGSETMFRRSTPEEMQKMSDFKFAGELEKGGDDK